ncbi:hypothetical protein [Desulfobotulus sp.]|uniref:hypothetical protein n=1 Tax=Desulfobotulus sp. TaxID=1940337 RepID=UPI002A36B37E|nr:hypothetical protein [Desulfobotulus sp.]MDY0163514.1 hypothetical protein [Desulfobotulus sp.]
MEKDFKDLGPRKVGRKQYFSDMFFVSVIGPGKAERTRHAVTIKTDEPERREKLRTCGRIGKDRGKGLRKMDGKSLESILL